ncbi:MAG: argininosuccinate synthase, partial [Methanoregulaceae archaeon]
MRDYHKNVVPVLIRCLVAVLFCAAASAATTEVHIIKYGPDTTTVLGEKTVTYQWMEQNLPVYGDGITHYYHQGPVFIDDADPAREEELRWNPAEDKNVEEKDMGAVKGSSIRDLCELVGGMQPSDTLTLKAEDGLSKTFAYRNVYLPPARQGEMVLTWYKADEGYVPAYRQGIRLIFFADNSTNPWGIHAFGNNDWHESADYEYWYFYQQGQPPEKYPTTTGLSVQYISEIRIHSVT